MSLDGISIMRPRAANEDEEKGREGKGGKSVGISTINRPDLIVLTTDGSLPRFNVHKDTSELAATVPAGIELLIGLVS